VLSLVIPSLTAKDRTGVCIVHCIRGDTAYFACTAARLIRATCSRKVLHAGYAAIQDDIGF